MPTLDEPPTPTPADPSHAPGPLSAEHLDQLAQAQLRSKKLRKAAGVASFSGWSTLIFGGLALPFGLFDLVTLILSVAMIAIGLNELKGRRLLRRLDPRGPRRLALNQLAFMTLLVSYAAFALHKAQTTPSELTQALGPDLGSTGEMIQGLEHTITIAVYSSLIVASVLFQGGAALYYHTRSRFLSDYLSATPDWIKDLQQRGQQLG